MTRIEVCGGIASGKTTLVKLLGKAGFGPIYENFRANPFWSSFFKQPDFVAYETEITFLLQHYNQIKTAGLHGGPIVTDFSPWLDLAYSHVMLSGKKQSTFLNVFSDVIGDIGMPSLLVYLKCGSDTLLQRIRKRARNEELTITVDFLDDLEAALSSVIAENFNDSILLTIDSSMIDFAQNAIGQKLVSDRILGLTSWLL